VAVVASPKEVRAARAFLRNQGALSSDIPPRKFANSAKELNMGFRKLLRLIARLYSGGQNQQQFRMSAIAAAAEAGK
jgi:hypothetical protein